MSASAALCTAVLVILIHGSRTPARNLITPQGSQASQRVCADMTTVLETPRPAVSTGRARQRAGPQRVRRPRRVPAGGHRVAVAAADAAAQLPGVAGALLRGRRDPRPRQGARHATVPAWHLSPAGSEVTLM